MRKFTVVTGHGKMDFIQKDNGKLEVVSVNGKPLSKRIGKLGKEQDRNASNNLYSQGES